MHELISVGARFIDNNSEVSVVIREHTVDRVVFSYEQYPQARHHYQRDAFIRDFSPVKANEINLDAYYDDQRRVNALIGSICAPVPATSENISRSRLLRAQVGLRHLLTEVIPQITDEQQRREVYLWIDGIYAITCFEEVGAGIQP
ncbi:hypothetical protein PZA22_04970 [Pectobacterium polaris]|uniref:hypothetical protein n=1 Tax=Pectobacterium polaris TaxID=2042057 RepID=UPI000EA056AA|nr:hypothetical protein [Pectobacterium polaris]MDE8753861.1 hypothetical protein [Pectobacterium polaris]RJL20062.1 hypothetical protein D5074_16985 [Pectobacterium polaris]